MTTFWEWVDARGRHWTEGLALAESRDETQTTLDLEEEETVTNLEDDFGTIVGNERVSANGNVATEAEVRTWPLKQQIEGGWLTEDEVAALPFRTRVTLGVVDVVKPSQSPALKETNERIEAERKERDAYREELKAELDAEALDAAQVAKRQRDKEQLARELYGPEGAASIVPRGGAK
jgi:hypothetical protein